MLQLERELVQARLKEAESQCALKEMQDKILDMEKVRRHGNPGHTLIGVTFNICIILLPIIFSFC